MSPRLVTVIAAAAMAAAACGSSDTTSDPTAEPLATSTTPSETEADDVAAASWPSPRIHSALFFDDTDDRILMVGGLLQMGHAIDARDMWAYDTRAGQWQLLDEVEPPYAFNFGYDEQSRVLVASNLVPPETWTYDVATGVWNRHEGGVLADEGRQDAFGMTMTYDRGSDRIIAFGGGRPGQLYDDTWAFDANTATWERMQPATSPPARAMHAMTYDARADRVVMWGGFFDRGEPDLDVWTYDYDGDAWERLPTTDGPSQHFERHGMVWIPGQDRILIFSGLIDDHDVIGPETWSYELADNTWTRLDTATSPPKLAMYGMTYDDAIDRIVVFGGESTSKSAGDLTSDVWLFDPATDTWEQRPEPS